MKWYAKESSSQQGIIAEENTGRTVAVSYDAKDMHILAAAPELLNALELAEATIERLVRSGKRATIEAKRMSTQGTRDVIRWAKQSAKGE